MECLCIEKLVVAWREAVYGPVVDKYPTKQQLKARYDKVQSEGSFSFRSHALNLRTIRHHHSVRACIAELTAEGHKHENKQVKFRAMFASKWRPNNREDAQQLGTAAAAGLGRVALCVGGGRGCVLSTETEVRYSLLEIRKRKTEDSRLNY
jgi:hypothetical protein